MKYIQLFCLLCLLGCTQMLSAQAGEKTYEITITTIDKDGNKEVKELVIVDENLSQEEIDELIQKELDGNEDEVDVNVNVNVSQNGEEGDTKTITKIIKQRSDLSSDNRVIIEEEEMEIEVIDDKVYINGEEVKEGDFGDKRVRIMKFEEGDDVDIEELLEGEGIEIGEDEKIYFIESEESKSGVAFLGVSPGKMTAAGLTIRKIIPGSSAEKVGLLANDILISIAGKKIESFDSLSKIVKSHLPEEKVKVVYQRNGETNEVYVALSDYESFANNEVQWRQKRSFNSEGAQKRPHHRGRKHHEGRKKGKVREDKAYLGVRVEEVKDQIQITKVVEESPAAKIGLQVGDVILKVNKAEMLAVEQFYYTIKAHEIGDEVKLKIDRDGKKQKLVAKLAKPQPRERKFKHNKSMRKKRIIIKDKKEARSAERETRGAIKINNFDLSPNPSNGKVKITFEMDALTAGEEFTLRVISLDGKVVREDIITEFEGQMTKEYDLLNTGPGIYLFQVDKNKQLFTKRFVIEQE